MRSRATIHVAGGKGVGKTSFVENILDSMFLIATCVRTEQDGKLHTVQVSSPRAHPELRRYREAGADTATLYRFARADDMDFYGADFMQDYSEVVLVEGAPPLTYFDLPVFIAEPPEEGRLLCRCAGDPVEADQESTRQAEELLEDRDALIAMLEDALGKEVVAMALRRPGALDNVVEAMRSRLEEQPSVRPPRSVPVWSLVPGYEGLVRAKLVVINLRSHADRVRAEEMLEDIKRLRKDPEVFDDVIGLRGRKTPITAVVADLSDPKDAGLKKALARVKRTIKNP